MSAIFDFRDLVARAHDDQPDAAIQVGIEALDDCRRRFGSPKTAAERVVQAQAYSAAVTALANRKPVSLEGLLVKLRAAEKRMHKAPVFQLQAAALRDAIEWLDPPKPKRGRRS
jgi:hypothetical protein